MKLSEKIGLITGGANGIGKITAKRFLEEGATVVISDVNEQAGIEAVNELKHYGDITFIQADVSKSDEVESMVQEIVSNHRTIDILINNAGITIDGFLTSMNEESWEKVIAVNLSGVFNCTKAVVPVMMAQQSGVILNASSVVGINGNIGQTNYAATKAGVIGMTKSWAKEFGPKGIRVNAIAPGFIATEMTAKVPPKVIELMKAQTPLKKLGKPEDIAAGYLYLASEDANFINGTILTIDGGLIM
ncbi:beta-ketoacyl-ACP reductase [Sporosarcina sp. Marseille-Q4063]|uniref:beta-ketoacyl-ACP reductase n=1 Tax=Sporosarcina sp. Marseille-Q4063 TaxID=2810514 RepID=UPI001BAF0195|nr:beta-ketoacyl-ACP reductase [Sporosarcina sp. Marseille-Q4063]QUW21100.1 beta-ketoacyl-ACP reductase [Sporosarcina sp. Marseille-Q4063]